MIPELEQMLGELRKERSDEGPGSTIMRVFECQNSMTHAAAKIGMKQLLITTCVTSSRPFASRAEWTFRPSRAGLAIRMAARSA